MLSNFGICTARDGGGNGHTVNNRVPLTHTTTKLLHKCNILLLLQYTNLSVCDCACVHERRRHLMQDRDIYSHKIKGKITFYTSADTRKYLFYLEIGAAGWAPALLYNNITWDYAPHCAWDPFAFFFFCSFRPLLPRLRFPPFKFSRKHKSAAMWYNEIGM